MSHRLLIITAVFAAAVLGFAWLTLPATPPIQPAASVSSIPTEKTAITSAHTSTSSGYSMAQVANHGNISSCWSAINGKVYDLTSWINQHPGGEQTILSICGTDGSSAFNAQHGGQSRPANELTNFYIGELTQ